MWCGCAFDVRVLDLSLGTFKRRLMGIGVGVIAEKFVEEWLHRDHFFTVRGLSAGVREIDLLALRNRGNGIETLHIEVSVSANPVGYMTPLTPEAAAELGANGLGAAIARPPHIVQKCAQAWVEKKFHHPVISARRNDFAPHSQWQMVFVHGVLNHPEELDHIRHCGIETIHISAIINNLRNPVNGISTSGEVKDIMRMMQLLEQ